jgi:capsular polysaccharide transport system permease protein
LVGSPVFRPPFAVTIAVWKALFLREAVYRLVEHRIAWVWLILEPIAHVSLMIWVFTGFRHIVIAGADSALFVTLGVLGFFLPRNVLIRAMDAIPQNTALFAYRQVKPVDTVIVRAGLEGFLEIVIFLAIFAGLGLLGYPAVPFDLLGVIEALAVLWLFGTGLGLIVSVGGQLVPEIARAARILINPVYFLSAVFYPTTVMPHAVREALLMNPFVHGIEALRHAFIPSYQIPAEINLGFPLACAVVLVFLGLALHVRFKDDLIEK